MMIACWEVGSMMAEEEKGCCEPWEAKRALPDVGLALAYPDVSGVNLSASERWNCPRTDTSL